MAKEKIEQLPSVEGFEKKLDVLAGEISSARKKLSKNEASLKRKISAKAKAEDALRKLLRKKFSSEKSVLSRVKSSSAKKQASLKQKIVSLEKINQVYDEKKARIAEARRKQNALKRQLQLLEKQAGAW